MFSIPRWMSPRIRMSLQSNTQDANASVVNVVNQVLEITGILLSSTILIKAAAAQHITKSLVIFHCLIWSPDWLQMNDDFFDCLIIIHESFLSLKVKNNKYFINFSLRWWPLNLSEHCREHNWLGSLNRVHVNSTWQACRSLGY